MILIPSESTDDYSENNDNLSVSYVPSELELDSLPMLKNISVDRGFLRLDLLHESRKESKFIVEKSSNQIPTLPKRFSGIRILILKVRKIYNRRLMYSLTTGSVDSWITQLLLI